jgi:hypothetical protein
MSKMVLLDARLYMGGADLSGDGNQIELTEETETKTTTNWRSAGAREVIGGLADTDLSADGYFEAGNLSLPDDAFWAQRRQTVPVSVAPEGDGDTGVGGLMYLTKMLTTSRQLLGGSVGDVASWTASAKGNWPLARGVVAHPSMVARTATGNGTSINLGAIPAGKHLYANLHVLSIAGTATPSLTVNVQSDDGTGFATPTTRGSFAAKTTITGEAIRIAGAVTDTWWRVTWTISGTNPSFLFLVSLGIE